MDIAPTWLVWNAACGCRLVSDRRGGVVGRTCHLARPTTPPVLVWVCDPPRLARSRHLPTLAANHPAHRGAGALLDHAPAREYGVPTRDTQSWLSSSWSFILLPHRWTWLDSTSWRQRAGTDGRTASRAPSHRGARRHVAEAHSLRGASLLLIALTSVGDEVITRSV